MLPTKFRFICPSGFSAEFFLEINQSETRLSCGGHVCDGSRRNEHLYRGPSIDASYQIYVYLVKRFQRKRFFLEIGQSETRIVCGSHTYDGLGRNEQSL
jgi:hypothetical protein